MVGEGFSGGGETASWAWAAVPIPSNSTTRRLDAREAPAGGCEGIGGATWASLRVDTGLVSGRDALLEGGATTAVVASFHHVHVQYNGCPLGDTSPEHPL